MSHPPASISHALTMQLISRTQLFQTHDSELNDPTGTFLESPIPPANYQLDPPGILPNPDNSEPLPLHKDSPVLSPPFRLVSRTRSPIPFALSTKPLHKIDIRPHSKGVEYEDTDEQAVIRRLHAGEAAVDDAHFRIPCNNTRSIKSFRKNQIHNAISMELDGRLNANTAPNALALSIDYAHGPDPGRCKVIKFCPVIKCAVQDPQTMNPSLGRKRTRRNRRKR